MPIFHEGFKHLPHRRTFDTEVHIDSLAAGGSGDQMAITDIDAASETATVIDDQQFAVIAQVEMQAAPEEGRRQKTADSHGTALELTTSHREGVTLAKAIRQNPDIESPIRRLLESIDESLSGIVGIKDIASQINRLTGLGDGLEHSGKRLLTIVQGYHPIAGQQRPTGYGIG